jgi:phage gp36-like protein
LGNYITPGDLEKAVGAAELIKLTTDTRNATEADADRVAEVIAYAEGTVEAYARVRYPLPLPVTQMVKSLCLRLAIFKLYEARASSDQGLYKIKRNAHDDAMSVLKSLRKGEAALDIPAAEETTTNPGSPDRVLKGNSKPVFTDENLESY